LRHTIPSQQSEEDFICSLSASQPSEPSSLAFAIVFETKVIPLEEMAKIFGNERDIVLHRKDLNVDENTHNLVKKD
jgi:hypothetical protein